MFNVSTRTKKMMVLAAANKGMQKNVSNENNEERKNSSISSDEVEVSVSSSNSVRDGYLDLGFSLEDIEKLQSPIKIQQDTLDTTQPIMSPKEFNVLENLLSSTLKDITEVIQNGSTMCGLENSSINEVSKTSSSGHEKIHSDLDFVPPDSSSYNSTTSIIASEDNSTELLDTTEEAVQTVEIKSSVTFEQTGREAIKKREKDYCFFCETLVLNFARHVRRSHFAEIEVQQALSLPLKSHKRKSLISDLRKKGNYLLSSSECFKPMRKCKIEQRRVPCQYCLGFYAPKQLWKHKRSCSQNQSLGGRAVNRLLDHCTINQNLKENVFPRMRFDKISLTAQKDVLICAYGARYMNTHREKHFVNVVSRKMRELSRLLLEVQKTNPSIKNLFEALQPQHYDVLVQSSKNVSNYSTETNTFDAPTYAMNIATALKQCCDIALTFPLKRKEIYSTVNAGESEANLKTLIQLLNSNWRFDISTQAAQDLNIKKWNKVTIVPLASDLKIFKEYLLRITADSKRRLQNDTNDISAYINLLEAIYCKVILLNRRRPGELQRLLLRDYKLSANSSNYEEFYDAISPSEKILMQSLKRLVIRGKRGRRVPVLFNKDVQEDIEVITKARPYLFEKTNVYFFGHPQTESHLCGYKVLAKHAQASGAKNPSALTSTRLRKHLATLSQIFNLKESELEQLSTFMGHTSDVHKNSYRLPDEVYLAAKIAKILLLMENGTCANFKGKSLEEIEVNMEEDLMEGPLLNDVDEEDVLNDINPNENIQLNETSISTLDSSTTSELPKKKCIRIPWTTEQKDICKQYFKQHIKTKRPPKRHECEQLIANHSQLFHNKNWLKIKVFIQNIYDEKCK